VVDALYEKKKILKLQQFLGDEVPKVLMTKEQPGDGDKLTAKERRGIVKRSNKLNRMFGAVPPPDAVADINFESSLLALRNAVSSEEGFRELVKFATALEGVTEETGPGGSESSLGSTKAARPNVVKKLNKLHNFFGNQIDINLVIENNILGPLERQMQKEIQGAELQVYMTKLHAIRREIVTRGKLVAMQHQATDNRRDSKEGKLTKVKDQIGKGFGEIRTFVRKASIDSIPKENDLAKQSLLTVIENPKQRRKSLSDALILPKE
jgi:hypothetical protein